MRNAFSCRLLEVGDVLRDELGPRHAVDVEDLAADPRRGRGGEVEHRGGDVDRLAVAAHRRALHHDAARLGIEAPEEVESAIDKANSINDRPVVVDFRVAADEKVFPMVAAGQSNDDIMLHPAQNARREFLR